MQDTEGLIAVHLHHPLADAFGPEHYFNVHSPLEAVSALDANYPSFRSAFAKISEYWVVIDGELTTFESAKDARLQMPIEREIHFVPKVQGNAFLGPALVGAIFPALGATATQIFGGLLMAGLLMGLSILIAPKKPKKEEETKKDENYAFSGPENVTSQGVPVPLIYGRVHAGSVVISASLSLGTDLSPDVPPPPPATVPEYPSGATPGLQPPPSGWPAIAQRNFRPTNYDHGSVTKVGPVGWDYMGNVSKMVIANGKAQRADVDYFRSPQQVWPGHPVAYYGWDRLEGFHTYNARLLNW